LYSKLESDEKSLWRRLVQGWEQLAGATIARHARPVRLERGRLIVAVDSAVWMNEFIRYERTPLLARLQRQYGADRIKNLNFQTDPRSAAGGETNL
jgi:predicted nucleic acid-binding Zn ribbon protein